MSYITDTSPAATAIEPVMRAHMLGAALSAAFSVMQQEQRVASCKCYGRSGRLRTPGALILVPIASATADQRESFTHGLRMACPRAVPALADDGGARSDGPVLLLHRGRTRYYLRLTYSNY
jgi:hypothetical protein